MTICTFSCLQSQIDVMCLLINRSHHCTKFKTSLSKYLSSKEFWLLIAKLLSRHLSVTNSVAPNYTGYWSSSLK